MAIKPFAVTRPGALVAAEDKPRGGIGGLFDRAKPGSVPSGDRGDAALRPAPRDPTISAARAARDGGPSRPGIVRAGVSASRVAREGRPSKKPRVGISPGRAARDGGPSRPVSTRKGTGAPRAGGFGAAFRGFFGKRKRRVTSPAAPSPVTETRKVADATSPVAPRSAPRAGGFGSAVRRARRNRRRSRRGGSFGRRSR